MAFRRTVISLCKITALSGLGIGCYYYGRYSERQGLLHSYCIDGAYSSIFPRVYATSALRNELFPGHDALSGISIEQSDVTKANSIQETKGLATNRISQIMKYGFPSLENIRSFDNFVLSYDRRNRVPNWVFEHLTKDTVFHNKDVDRSKCDFFEDASIHPYFRASNSDYKRSGFDRGHIAAAGNHKSTQKTCEQTFVLSNIAPQVGDGFNRGTWNRLEKHVRKLLKNYTNVYVCTGPLYLPKVDKDGKSYVKYQVIGANTVAVPTHFFKVVVMEAPDNTLEMEAYVLPNQFISEDTPLSVFQVPPESIERAAGLLLFDKLPRNSLKRINGKSSRKLL